MENNRKNGSIDVKLRADMILVVKIDGAFNESLLNEMGRAICARLDDRPLDFVLDFTGVDRVNSDAYGRLSETLIRFRELGARHIVSIRSNATGMMITAANMAAQARMRVVSSLPEAMRAIDELREDGTQVA